MVGATHGNPDGFGASGSRSQETPPLPPPPSLVEVMAVQTELLRQIARGSNPIISSGFYTMHPNLRLLVTRISLERSPLCLARRRNY
jgi:hypothetical protein